jgi:CRISPR-associated protein Cas1
MMIYNLITVRLLSYGFEPSIGFLHKPFRSHNALASDIMELFRAEINEFIFGLFDRKLLSSSDFTKKDGVYLKYSSRRNIWVEFQEFIQRLEPNIDREIANIRRYL